MPRTPTGRPYPSAARAGPEGLGCNRRCVGGGPDCVPPKPPQGFPIPPRPRQDRRDSGVTAVVQGGTSPGAPEPPRDVPIPPRPRQDKRDSGVTAAVWGRNSFACPHTPTGRPYPSAAQAGPEGLGCNRRCVAEGLIRVPPYPHWASLSLRGPGRTGGTRV